MSVSYQYTDVATSAQPQYNTPSQTKMDRFTTCFALLLAIVAFSDGLYFHIAETERKCFIEEIPDETMVVGK